MCAIKYKYTERDHILVVKLELKFKLFVNYSICNDRKIPKLVFHMLLLYRVRTAGKDQSFGKFVLK